MNPKRLELTVFVDNAPAIALYERHGFTTEGTFRAYAFRDGVFVDAYAMARTSSPITARRTNATASGRRARSSRRFPRTGLGDACGPNSPMEICDRLRLAAAGADP